MFNKTPAIVYKNLIRGDWSLATPAGKSGTGRGKVFGHTDSVILMYGKCIVQESARHRSLNVGPTPKNVVTIHSTMRQTIQT